MSKVTMIANRYLILKHIGKGGMADVYIALDTVLNREVAIKILKGELSSDPIALERFKREAQASTKLSHPNIVDIYDVGDDGINHYIVMEYIKGMTLKQLIQKRGPLYYPEAISMMKQLCSAIMESHRNGIIHRDIKSQNVLIKDDGTVKIVDFGIALANNAMQITSEDNVLGSVHYIAPEVAKGSVANMQSDIYSLGIVFYELLVGDVPFKGENAVQVVMQALKKDIPFVRDYDKRIPQSVENIILKATAKNTNNRYQNVTEMLKDLNECLSEKHANDQRVNLTFVEDLNKNDVAVKENGKNKIKNKTKAKSKNKKKDQKLFDILYIGGITIFTIIAVVVILYLGGVIKFDSKKTTVPDIINKKVLEANEILDNEGLILDLDSIERVLTEDTKEGLIIDVTPKVGTEVEKGQSIKIIVSEGIFEIMADYTGQDIDDVKREFEEKYPNIRIVGQAVVSEETPGTILEQTGIEADSKFDPTKKQTITFAYSAYTSEILPLNLIGMNLEEAQETLRSLGIKSVVEGLSYDQLTESEISEFSAGQVVRTSPKVGSSFMQTNNSYVTLYYMEY